MSLSEITHIHPRAKRDHICAECISVIFAGQRHAKFVYRDSGRKLHSLRYHLRCESGIAMEKVKEAIGDLLSATDKGKQEQA